MIGFIELVDDTKEFLVNIKEISSLHRVKRVPSLPDVEDSQCYLRMHNDQTIYTSYSYEYVKTLLKNALEITRG